MKTCFVISPIGRPGTEVRQNADRVFEQIIATALPLTLWDVKRADSPPFASAIITDRIVEMIENSDLCVVDVTTLNANVMYELGIREHTKLPFVTIATEGTDLPFDIKGRNTVFYNLNETSSITAAVRAISQFATVVSAKVDQAANQQPKGRPATPFDELRLVDDIAQRISAVISSTNCWEKAAGDARAYPVEFRYAFGMRQKEWIEPYFSSENPHSQDKSKWPGHKRIQLSRSQKAELGIDWPGVVYDVTEKHDLFVSSKVLQDFCQITYHTARCLFHNALSPESVRALWRSIDLGLPKNIQLTIDHSDDYPHGEFWRWVEFFVFGNAADERLIKVNEERLRPWLLLHDAVIHGPHRIGHH